MTNPIQRIRTALSDRLRAKLAGPAPEAPTVAAPAPVAPAAPSMHAAMEDRVVAARDERMARIFGIIDEVQRDTEAWEAEWEQQSMQTREPVKPAARKL